MYLYLSLCIWKLRTTIFGDWVLQKCAYLTIAMFFKDSFWSFLLCKKYSKANKHYLEKYLSAVIEPFSKEPEALYFITNSLQIQQQRQQKALQSYSDNILYILKEMSSSLPSIIWLKQSELMQRNHNTLNSHIVPLSKCSLSFLKQSCSYFSLNYDFIHFLL